MIFNNLAIILLFPLLSNCGGNLNDQYSDVAVDQNSLHTLTLNGVTYAELSPEYFSDEVAAFNLYEDNTETDAEEYLDKVKDRLVSDIESWVSAVGRSGRCTTSNDVQVPMNDPVDPAREFRRFNKSVVYSDIIWCVNSDEFEKAIEIINRPSFKINASDSVLEATPRNGNELCVKTDTAALGLVKPTHSCNVNSSGFSEDRSTYAKESFVVDARVDGADANVHPVYLNHKITFALKLEGAIAIKQIAISRGQKIPGLGRGAARSKIESASDQALRNLRQEL